MEMRCMGQLLGWEEMGSLERTRRCGGFPGIGLRTL